MRSVLIALNVSLLLFQEPNGANRPSETVSKSTRASQAIVTTTTLAAGIDSTSTETRPPLRLCRVGRDGGQTECEKSAVLHPDGSGSDASTPEDPLNPSTPSTERIYAPYERIVHGGGLNGEDCTTTGYREVPAGVEPGIVSAIPDRDFGDIRRTYPECPAQPGVESEAPTPASYAVHYWQEIPLPKPLPHIAPGRAITGMPAYLETRGTTSHSFSDPNTPFGPLTITATGRYYVDWGDGTQTGPHAGEGGPWPDGQITHEYINVGAYDVVVTERWTATWSFGVESGTLDELRTVGRIDDFPVGQVQAVVLR